MNLIFYEGDKSNLLPWDRTPFMNIDRNIGYRFHLIGREEMEYDSEEIIRKKIESGEYDPENPPVVEDCFRPIFGLERVNLTGLPTEGNWWYLPVRIIFNESQSTIGLALFDAEEQKILDLSFWNDRHGLMTAIFRNDDNITLEDCGFFKNDKLFRYEILLDNTN